VCLKCGLNGREGGREGGRAGFGLARLGCGHG